MELGRQIEQRRETENMIQRVCDSDYTITEVVNQVKLPMAEARSFFFKIKGPVKV